jgi:hypothetical protein
VNLNFVGRHKEMAREPIPLFANADIIGIVFWKLAGFVIQLAIQNQWSMIAFEQSKAP